MKNVLTSEEKNKLRELLNSLLSEQKTADNDNDASVQLDISIRSLIDTLNVKDVDYLYAAEHVEQITNNYYLLKDYEHAMTTCEIAFDYYRRYEEISGEITVGRTKMYWNRYCLLKLCNMDKETLISANMEAKARIEKYYHEDENQRKELIAELDDDKDRYESDDEEEITFVGEFKDTIRKHKNFFIIFFSVAILWLVANNLFYSIANNSIYTAIKVYLYDGSSVINRYTELEIQNDNYKKGEQLRRECKYSDATPFFEKALTELQKDYSENDLIIAQTRMHLGVSYLSTDKLSDAHEQFSNAYVAYKNALGDDNDNTNEARMYWAITNQMESDYETAIRDATDAFEKMKYFGIKQEVSYYLSDFFNRKGDYKLALEWNDKYLGYIDSIVGRLSNYAYIRKASGEILRGDIFLDARELENSEASFVTALEDLEKAENAPGKEDFSQTINDLRFRAYQRLSIVKSGLGDDNSSNEMLAKALEYYDNIGGNDYDSLYLSSLEAYKNNSGDLQQILLNNLDQTIAINGENNEYTVRQLGILSEYYLRERDFNNALEVNERALAIQKNLLAEETPESLSIYADLAACCLGLEDYDRAEDWDLEGLKISTKIYGYKAQRTKRYIIGLVACMNQTQQYEKALTIIEICKLLEIPEAEKSSQSSWSELEKKYISKVNDKNIVNTCIDKAEKLVASIDDNNFPRIIAETIE